MRALADVVSGAPVVRRINRALPPPGEAREILLLEDRTVVVAVVGWGGTGLLETPNPPPPITVLVD